MQNPIFLPTKRDNPPECRIKPIPWRHPNPCTAICKKANYVLLLGLLKRNLKYCPQNCKRLAYISLVRPILEYSSTCVCDSHLQCDN